MNERDRPSIEIDEDVRAVAAYMVASIPAARLVAVAKAMSEMAPLLWSQYIPEPVQPLRFVYAPISACGRHTPATANGSCLAQQPEFWRLTWPGSTSRLRPWKARTMWQPAPAAKDDDRGTGRATRPL
jgi:hypothetical protein